MTGKNMADINYPKILLGLTFKLFSFLKKYIELFIRTLSKIDIGTPQSSELIWAILIILYCTAASSNESILGSLGMFETNVLLGTNSSSTTSFDFWLTMMWS